MNVDSFVLESLVIHDVPQSDDPDEQIRLTDAPIGLDDDLRRYFKRKISQSLAARGLDVVADPNGSPVVRDAVVSILADGRTLVSRSQDMARHLDASQTRRNPAGLLAVGRGRLDDGPIVAVLKLEREQGVRFRITRNADGHLVVDLEFLRELTLTDKTRIFKTSLLRPTDAAIPLTTEGRASDDQRGRDEVGIADFFLATFLGCALRANPEKATRDFVLAAEEFINQDVVSPERKARYLIALQAKLQEEALDLAPRGFANASILAQDRPSFLARLAERDVEVDAAFQKDLSLVKTDRFKIVFDHGMVLLSTPEDVVENRLDIEDAVNGSRVEIRDGIKRLQGR
jgi:hypothetical protein